MQYQFSERFEYVKTVEFFNSEPLEDVQKIRFFKEEEVTGFFTKKQFRYSFDNVTWTSWNTLSQHNLADIEFRNEPEFWLQVKYTRIGISAGNISRWYLYYDSDVVTPPVTLSDASIDADTLAGEGPSYYLDRANHTGPYTTLSAYNVVDGSTIGVYSYREDTSLGTSLYFRRIGSLTDNIIVTESGGKILLDLSINNVDTSINELYQYVDSSLITRDSSISQLFSLFGTYDSSIGLLNDWNVVQDLSISFSSAWNIVQDASIVILRNTLVLIESSLGNVSIWNQYQDASIISLRSAIGKTDSSISRIDVSMNVAFDTLVSLDASVEHATNLNIVQDASITRIDSMILLRDVSISTLYDWQVVQDVSIVTLRNNISLIESSLGNVSIWNQYQDASIISLRSAIGKTDSSISRIDGSINIIFNDLLSLDASVEHATNLNIVQDASITRIDSMILLRDVSISTLYDWQVVQDASIISLRSAIDKTDSSIFRIDVSINVAFDTLLSLDASVEHATNLNIVQDTSITNLRNSLSGLEPSIARIDVSLNNLLEHVLYTDSSVAALDMRASSIEASIVLIKDDQVLNIGDGSMHIFSQRDVSNNILLKTIGYIGPVVMREDSSTIIIDSSIVKLYDTMVDLSAYMPYTIGGLTKGVSIGSLVNDTYTSILDEMLFPTVNPSINEPSHTFTIDVSQVQLADDNIYVNFTTTFDRGTIEVNEIFQNYRSGLPNTYIYTGIDISGNYASSSLVYTIPNEPIDVELGVTTWLSKVRYDAGPQPEDNKGNPVGSLLDASTTLDASVSIEGVWPLYATTITIGTLTQQAKLSMINTEDVILTLVPETGGNKQRFDVPDQWENSPTNRPLQGVYTYNEVAQTWNWEGGTQAIALTHWDVSTTTHTIGSNVVDYISYTYNDVDRSIIKIKLIF